MRYIATMLGAALLAASAGMALAAEDNRSAGPATNVQATGMSDAQIRQKLEAEGYTNVQIKDHDKTHVDVTATKNGKATKLAVNPQSGQVTADNDSD